MPSPYEKTNYINVPITSSSFSLEIPATRDMTALWGLLDNHEENDDEMEWLCKACDFAERVLVNGDATIVFWADGTKTVVRWSGEEEYSVYSAFCAALAIKLYGSNSRLKKVLEAITQEQKSKPKKKRVEPTEFIVGDYVRPKKHEIMTDGKWPRKVMEIDRGDNTVKLSDFEEAWWDADALEIAEAPSPRNVFRVGEKVRLRKGLEVGDLYGELAFTLNKKNIMEALGYSTVIEADPKDNSYLLAGCGEHMWYHGNMLELAE